MRTHSVRGGAGRSLNVGGLGDSRPSSSDGDRFLQRAELERVVPLQVLSGDGDRVLERSEIRMPFASRPYSPAGNPTNSNRPARSSSPRILSGAARSSGLTVVPGTPRADSSTIDPLNVDEAALCSSHGGCHGQQHNQNCRAGTSGNRIRVRDGRSTWRELSFQDSRGAPSLARETRWPPLVERARQLDEMRGVIRTLEAAAHHFVVARVLALEPQPPAGDPEQWIEPVEGPQQLGGELHNPVAAADVRELVR